MLRTRADTGGLSKLRQSLGGLKTLIGGLSVGAGLAALVRNINEAEKATAQLDAAFANTGDTVGLTRSRLDDLASEIQRTTTVSDDLVKEAESILLTFDRVRGQAFERTVRVAADLSARLGTDLKTAVRSVGLALQDPERGLIALRRSGVAFSESQRNIINRLIETNQAAKAQEIILAELERRFAGSAAAARNTLGGALTGLKNAFGDLFEGTRESTSGLVSSINSLSQTLSDPKIKAGIDTLISGFTRLVDILIRGVAAIGNFDAALVKFATQKGGAADSIRGFLATALPAPLQPLALLAQAGASKQGRVGPQPVGSRQASRGSAPSIDEGGVKAELEEFNVTVREIVDRNGDLMRELEESTKTSTERVAGEYIRLKETLKLLRDEGVITQEVFEKRLGGALDELLPEFDLNEIRAKYKTLQKETTELGEFMKGVWQGVGNSIRSTISDALVEWRLSWRSLIDIARRALADITAAIITSGIKKALAGAIKSSSTSSSGGFLKAIAGLFGLASGGQFDGIRKVGEEGPEIVAGRGVAMNSRQLAFAAAGGSKFIFSPTLNFTVQSTGDPERDKQEIYERVALMMSSQQEQFTRILARSGVEVRG